MNQEEVKSEQTAIQNDRGIFMWMDHIGSGYWRMVFPSKYMDCSDVYIDIGRDLLNFESLLGYDTILVNNIHYDGLKLILQGLKNAGKRIVYDLDDDIFTLASVDHNGMQLSPLECIEIADVVTCTTSKLQEKIREATAGKVEAVVIPNAINVDETWKPISEIGSKDGWKRLFYSGSGSHEQDWSECFDAVRQVMEKRADVRLVFCGFLPRRIKDVIQSNPWRDRVDYVGWKNPEEYFASIKDFTGDVGLIPLQAKRFNESKSCIKWIEYSMGGIPCVASKVGELEASIKDGEGMLCTTTDEWVAAIEKCLDDPELCKSMIEKSREHIRASFNIKDVAIAWKKALLGE